MARTSPDNENSRLAWRGPVTSLVTALAMATLPAAVSLTLLHQVLETSLQQYSAGWSDEAYLWHQAASFAKVGWDGGFYSYQEVIAPAGTPWGAWGPSAPMLYGAVMSLAGVSTTAVVKTNVLAVVIGSVGWSLLAPVRWHRAAMLAMLLAVFGPLHLYLLTGMQEALHLGAAVLIGACLGRVLHRPRDRRARLLAAVVIFASALVRPTWAFLLLAVPVGLSGSWRVRAASWATAVFALAVPLLTFAQLAAPYPYESSATWTIRQAPDARAAIAAAATNLRANVESWFDVGRTGFPMGVMTDYLIVVVIALLLVLLAASRWSGDPAACRRAVVTMLVVLVPALVFVLTVYDVQNGTRVLAAHLLCAAATSLATPGRRVALVAGVVLAASVLGYGRFLHEYRARMPLNFSAASGVDIPQLRYSPGSDRWCNTVLYTLNGGGINGSAAYSIPPGVGIGLAATRDFDHRVRARWILGDEATAGTPPYDRWGLQRLGTSPVGVLYANPGGACQEP